VAVSRQKRVAGAWTVRRTFVVPGLVHVADVATIGKALRELPGIQEFQADPRSHKVRVHYDITCCEYRSIEHALEGSGFPVQQTRFARWRSNWYQYLDTTGRENAAAPAPQCCSRPPKH
jgi:copper chaperone CopZ